MAAEVGQFALILALLLAAIQAVVLAVKVVGLWADGGASPNSGL